MLEKLIGKWASARLIFISKVNPNDKKLPIALIMVKNHLDLIAKLSLNFSKPRMDCFLTPLV